MAFGNQMVTHVTDDVTTPKGQTRDLNTLTVQYLKNCWKCYLATITNYYIACCKAVPSAILAIAWLLVRRVSVLQIPLHACECCHGMSDLLCSRACSWLSLIINYVVFNQRRFHNLLLFQLFMSIAFHYCRHSCIIMQTSFVFLADRTNGRDFATVLCLSVCSLSVVCSVCILAKLPEEANKKWPMGIEWSRDR